MVVVNVLNAPHTLPDRVEHIMQEIEQERFARLAAEADLVRHDLRELLPSGVMRPGADTQLALQVASAEVVLASADLELRSLSAKSALLRAALASRLATAAATASRTAALAEAAGDAAALRAVAALEAAQHDYAAVRLQAGIASRRSVSPSPPAPAGGGGAGVDAAMSWLLRQEAALAAELAAAESEEAEWAARAAAAESERSEAAAAGFLMETRMARLREYVTSVQEIEAARASAVAAAEVAGEAAVVSALRHPPHSRVGSASPPPGVVGATPSVSAASTPRGVGVGVGMGSLEVAGLDVCAVGEATRGRRFGKVMREHTAAVLSGRHPPELSGSIPSPLVAPGWVAPAPLASPLGLLPARAAALTSFSSVSSFPPSPSVRAGRVATTAAGAGGVRYARSPSESSQASSSAAAAALGGGGAGRPQRSGGGGRRCQVCGRERPPLVAHCAPRVRRR